MPVTPQWSSFTTTPIFNRPAIRFPAAGTIGEIEIPIHITKLSSQDEGTTVIEVSAGALIDPASNLGSGGMAVSYGADKLSKVVLEGYIDTPATPLGNLFTSVPNIIIDGNRVNYAEIIAAYFEGRTSTNSGGLWQQTYPKWFRDPFGRVYGNAGPTGPVRFIRIYDFTAQRIEAVPGRTNITMTLQV